DMLEQALLAPETAAGKNRRLAGDIFLRVGGRRRDRLLEIVGAGGNRHQQQGGGEQGGKFHLSLLRSHIRAKSGVGYPKGSLHKAACYPKRAAASAIAL